MGLARDTSSWYVQHMWQVILKSVHTRKSYSPDITTNTLYPYMQLSIVNKHLSVTLTLVVGTRFLHATRRLGMPNTCGKLF